MHYVAHYTYKPRVTTPFTKRYVMEYKLHYVYKFLMHYATHYVMHYHACFKMYYISHDKQDRTSNRLRRNLSSFPNSRHQRPRPRKDNDAWVLSRIRLYRFLSFLLSLMYRLHMAIVHQPSIPTVVQSAHNSEKLLLGSQPRRGRPLKPSAKSRDPQYRAWTGYMKRTTLVEAEYCLKSTGEGQSVSELLERLLSGWLVQQGRI